MNEMIIILSPGLHGFNPVPVGLLAYSNQMSCWKVSTPILNMLSCYGDTPAEALESFKIDYLKLFPDQMLTVFPIRTQEAKTLEQFVAGK